MAAATHNLCVKVGEYTTMGGETKARWQRIGTVFKHDDGGSSIKLECMPVGVPDWEGWVSIFPRDQQQDGAQQQQGYQQQTQGYQQQPQSEQAQQRRPLQRRRQQQVAPAQQHMPSAEFDDDIPF